MIRRMIRQRADKFLEALQRAATHSTTLDEVILGAILGFVLYMIMAFLELFD